MYLGACKQVFLCSCLRALCCDAREEPGCNGPAQFVCTATQRPSRSTDSIGGCGFTSNFTQTVLATLWVTVELGMNGCTDGWVAGDMSVCMYALLCLLAFISACETRRKNGFCLCKACKKCACVLLMHALVYMYYTCTHSITVCNFCVAVCVCAEFLTHCSCSRAVMSLLVWGCI